MSAEADEKQIIEIINGLRDSQPAPRSATWRGRFLGARFGVLLAVGVGEVALRIIPLPIVLETYLFECYTTSDERSRITFQSQVLATPLLKPSFDATCAWDGYRWHHHTDAFGARNPETWEQVDVVLLGDSMIYWSWARGGADARRKTPRCYLGKLWRVRLATFTCAVDSELLPAAS